MIHKHIVLLVCITLAIFAAVTGFWASDAVATERQTPNPSANLIREEQRIVVDNSPEVWRLAWKGLLSRYVDLMRSSSKMPWLVRVWALPMARLDHWIW
jgi:hypothetical protein